MLNSSVLLFLMCLQVIFFKVFGVLYMIHCCVPNHEFQLAPLLFFIRIHNSNTIRSSILSTICTRQMQTALLDTSLRVYWTISSSKICDFSIVCYCIPIVYSLRFQRTMEHLYVHLLFTQSQYGLTMSPLILIIQRL